MGGRGVVLMGVFLVVVFLLHYQISLINFLVMQIGSVAPETALSVWRAPIYFETIQRQFEGVSVKIQRDPGGNPSLSECSDAQQRGCLLATMAVQLLATQCKQSTYPCETGCFYERLISSISKGEFEKAILITTFWSTLSWLIAL